jgi:hypothetical protein
MQRGTAGLLPVVPLVTALQAQQRVGATGRVQHTRGYRVRLEAAPQSMIRSTSNLRYFN